MRKFFLIFAGIVAGAILLFVVSLKLFLTDERLRAYIEPALEEQLGREVSVGQFEVRLLRSFPNLSVGASDIAIHTPDNEAGPRPDLARVDRLWIDIALLPLLQSKIHVNAVEIVHPLVLVEVYDDLSNNLVEMGEETASESGEAADGSESVVKEIAIERFVVSNGEIAYSHADGTLLTIGDMNADLKARLGELADISGLIVAGNTYYETGGIVYADGWDIALDMAATANLDSSWVRVERAVLSLESLLLEMQGSVNNWDSDRIGVDLAISAPDATIEGIWSLLPAAMVKDVEGLKGAGEVDVTATILGEIAENELPEVNSSITVRNASIQYPSLPAAIEGIQLDAALTLDEFVIEQLAASAAGATLQAKGRIAQFAAPRLDLDLQLDADLSSIQSYYPLEEGTSLSGRLKLDTHVEGDLDTYEAAQAEGEVVLENIGYASASLEQPVEGLQGRLLLSRNEIDIEELTFNSGQSDFRFDGAVEDYLAFMADSAEAGVVPAIRGNLTSTYLNVSEQLSEDTTAVGPIELPALSADVSFAADKLDYEGIVLSSASGRITLDKGVIGFEDATAGFLEGLLRASGKFDLSDPFQPAFQGAFGLDKVKASQFFTAFDALDQVAKLGTFLEAFFDSEATLALKMDKDLNPLLASLLAEGTFGATGGALKGMPIQNKLAELTGLNQLNSLSIGKWTHRFSISGEKLHIQDLQFTAGDFTFGVNGYQGFDGTLDYLLRVELPESAASTLAGAPVQSSIGPVAQLANATLVDPATGHITLDFQAGGTFLDPQIRLNADMLKSRLNARASALAADVRNEAQARLDSLENAARLKAEAELEAQKMKLEAEAKEAAGNLLEGVIGKPGDSSGVATGLDSLQEKGGEVLKDRLKGLLKRGKNDN